MPRNNPPSHEAYQEDKGTDHYFSGGGGGGMENIEKICLQGLKLQNKLLANMISTSFLGSFFANSLLGGRTKYPGKEVKVNMLFAYGPEIMQKKKKS